MKKTDREAERDCCATVLLSNCYESGTGTALATLKDFEDSECVKEEQASKGKENFKTLKITLFLYEKSNKTEENVKRI